MLVTPRQQHARAAGIPNRVCLSSIRKILSQDRGMVKRQFAAPTLRFRRDQLPKDWKFLARTGAAVSEWIALRQHERRHRRMS